MSSRGVARSGGGGGMDAAFEVATLDCFTGCEGGFVYAPGAVK